MTNSVVSYNTIHYPSMSYTFCLSAWSRAYWVIEVVIMRRWLCSYVVES